MATAAQTPPPVPVPKDYEENVAHLFELLGKFESSILVTKTMDGMDHMHGRPMRIAAVEDGAAWFFTAIESNKVREAQTDSEGYIVCQEAARQLFLRGVLSVTKDRARIDKYWSKGVEVWFPEGRDDPSLCLMKFVPREGEYWDTSGAKGVKYLLEAAKALITGTTPNVSDKDQHARVVV